MNPLHVLRDAWFFFSGNLLPIARLCLPLLVLEALVQQQIIVLFGVEAAAAYGILVGLLFYPLYTGALILFLDARSNGQSPRLRDLLVASLNLWPRFALLAGISTVAIMLGASLFVLPGLWMMIKLAFAEYLLVLRGMTPVKALHESFELTSGYFWPILFCVLAVMVPLWLLAWWSQPETGAQTDVLLTLLLDSANGFLQLFATVVLFRLFMLRGSQPAVE
ncbi:membrane protein [Pseudomonas taeanensis MS-3]|uniref:Membrane protein n=1 Tax=Pseudomonas taeanensis MS-3 TaxID=1395571 RepID=A0A0A1YET3_9PSED|nr:YciC family protein [Pseudomonas taeanensis]KFX67493.1 membrane protein [Pseudomonas taeanensis MS-3]